MGGSYRMLLLGPDAAGDRAEDGEGGKGTGETWCLLGGAAVYVSPEMRLGMSRSFGVRPARMTLSELAMHSMMSGWGAG